MLINYTRASYVEGMETCRLQFGAWGQLWSSGFVTIKFH